MIIGARQIYDKLIENSVQQNQMASDLKILDHLIRDLIAKQKSHEERLTAVERKTWIIPSASTAVALLALIVSVFPRISGG